MVIIEKGEETGKEFLIFSFFEEKQESDLRKPIQVFGFVAPEVPVTHKKKSWEYISEMNMVSIK
jgi:hypothetical protein